MDYLVLLEWSATSFSLLFLILLIRRDIRCWPFGILSSALSILLFIEVKLYSEAVLYALYIVFGIYGWIHWRRSLSQDEVRVPIAGSSLTFNLQFAALALICALALGSIWKTTSEASYPYADALTTSFALLATWMEAKRIFETWYYWIIINAASVLLYALKGLHIYASLMVLYAILSIWGWYSWKKERVNQRLAPDH